MAKGIAIALLAVSLILLIIYGADVMVATSSPNGKGFLRLGESVRGGGLGGGAVVMSIIAFVIARKERTTAVSALLFVNGGLIIAGMIVLMARGPPTSEAAVSAMRIIASTIAMGAILICLGVWKVASERKVVAKGKESP